MKNLFVLLTIFVAQSVSAVGPMSMRAGIKEPIMTIAGAPAVVDPDPNTYLGKTFAWYEAGLATKWIDVKGFWVGRCFWFDEQNTAINSFLGYLASHAGPGFDELPSVIDSIWMPTSTADYFDNLTDYRSAIRDFNTISSPIAHKYGPVLEDPTVNQLYDMEPNNRPDQLTEIRYHEGKLIVKLTNLIAQTLMTGPMKSRKMVAQNQILSMCYYFRKVAE